MEKRQRLCILGATGSVGMSTLEVVARHPQRFEVFALTARQRIDELAALCERWRPRVAVVDSAQQARNLRERLLRADVPTEVRHGAAALAELAAHPEVDTVMAAIVGAAGLAPCLAAARAGKRLLLANKEALVVGGGLFMRAVRAGGATLLPIDSEHSAIFQCLPTDRSSWARRIDHIVLTASGGPFRERDPATLHAVTPQQACAHPNWVMGRKISVDSATMMNKALEVIEAHWLFELGAEQIRVVIHPQSIVHSMVVHRDQSVLAQLGTPDMKVPIACGLAWPERIDSGAAQLDFTSLGALTFETPDTRRFPGLALAYDCLRAPPGATNVLNAANETAVAAFLEGAIRFPDIHAVNAATLEHVAGNFGTQDALDDLLALDERARAVARQQVRGRAT
ncbi:MAG TPA: 1-deoxy-D-xylulose-5-phosphate reductoisomerase [Burkholderiaceae bacterium]|nr:1-deoxy-D-xylulose-5-phosphate reductoisomerase [Burkholderiaceae bacterium]